MDIFGKLYTWGESTDECLGHKFVEDLVYPKPVYHLKKSKCVDLTMGDRYTVV